MIKYSFIVPVYNTEKYLKKCLDSLVNQTYKDFEIIVVNDGSTDKSSSIISKYQKKYNKASFFTLMIFYFLKYYRKLELLIEVPIRKIFFN